MENPFEKRRHSWNVLPTVALAAASTMFIGCTPTSEMASETEPTSEETVAAVDPHTLLAAVLAHPERPDADREDDANRRPGDVLAFFGIEPEMKVLDLLAGGGYYTEILSRYLGADGEVIFHNNQQYVDFLGEALDQRLAGGRLANVASMVVGLNDLELPQDALDAAILILGYHDTYWEPEDGSWPKVDRDRLLGEIHAALKPGAILGIVDHSARPGQETAAVVDALHRIDENVVRADLEAAGFVLDGESDVLRNAEDPLDVLVFDDSIRRRTDRFVLRYKRP